MSKCQRCNSENLFEFNGKTSDCFWCKYKGQQYEGYVIGPLGDDADYIIGILCLDCGQLQGNWPFNTTEIEEYIAEDNED